MSDAYRDEITGGYEDAISPVWKALERHLEPMAHDGWWKPEPFALEASAWTALLEALDDAQAHLQRSEPQLQQIVATAIELLDSALPGIVARPSDRQLPHRAKRK